MPWITFGPDPTPLLKLILANQATLNTQVKFIMATQAELAKSLTDLQATVDAIGTEVDKIGTETAALQASVATLTAELGDVTTTPEVDAALAAVQASAASLATKVKTVDDMVPDASSPPTPSP